MKPPDKAVFLTFNDFCDELYSSFRNRFSDEDDLDSDDIDEFDRGERRHIRECLGRVASALESIASWFDPRGEILKLNPLWVRYLRLYEDERNRIRNEAYDQARKVAYEQLGSLKCDPAVCSKIEESWAQLISSDEAPLLARRVWQAFDERASIRTTSYFTKIDRHDIDFWVAVFLDRELMRDFDLQDGELFFRNMGAVLKSVPEWAEIIRKLNKWPPRSQ